MRSCPCGIPVAVGGPAATALAELRGAGRRRQLSDMKLTGKLPLDGQLWSHLPALQELDLASNDVSGFVPPQLVPLCFNALPISSPDPPAGQGVGLLRECGRSAG